MKEWKILKLFAVLLSLFLFGLGGIVEALLPGEAWFPWVVMCGGAVGGMVALYFWWQCDEE